MKPFQPAMAVFIIASLLVCPFANGDDHSETRNYGTVKLYFLNQFLPQPDAVQDAATLDPFGGGGRGMGGMGGMGVGGMFDAWRLETCQLYLDDKFIGHVMTRHVEVKPTLNLTPGEHTFRIESEGYKTFERKLFVLENGSVQWLVIKLEPEAKQEPAAASKNKPN